MEHSFPLITKGMPCPGLSTELQETCEKSPEKTVLITKAVENMTCEEKLAKTLYSTAVAGRTRRNGFKLQQGQLTLDIRKHFVIAGLL